MIPTINQRQKKSTIKKILLTNNFSHDIIFIHIIHYCLFRIQFNEMVPIKSVQQLLKNKNNYRSTPFHYNKCTAL